MSQENVEVVRRWIEFYNGRDTDGLMQLTTSDYEMKSVFADVESGGIFRGYAGFPFEYFKTLDDAYDQFQLVVQDFIDVGAAVLMVAHIEWRGRGSGAEGRGFHRGPRSSSRPLRHTARAMSQENVEIVKRLKAAFNEKDLEAFAALTTPDFEWTTSMMAVEGEVFWGREGIEKYFERMREVWEEFRGFAREYRDLGERVLWIGRLEGRGRGSGIPVDAALAVLYDLRDGKISRMHSYLDHGEALRAAGLSG
jgi:ketosteroid isomerase-like protein